MEQRQHHSGLGVSETALVQELCRLHPHRKVCWIQRIQCNDGK